MARRHLVDFLASEVKTVIDLSGRDLGRVVSIGSDFTGKVVAIRHEVGVSSQSLIGITTAEGNSFLTKSAFFAQDQEVQFHDQ